MHSSELTGFKKPLAQQGLPEDDFSVTENDLTQSYLNVILPIKAEVTVKRKSSKIERSYQSGKATHWVADFHRDL